MKYSKFVFSILFILIAGCGNPLATEKIAEKKETIPPPTIRLTANRDAIVAGDSVLLTVSGTNLVNSVLQPKGTVFEGNSGSIVDRPIRSTLYRVTGKGLDGSTVRDSVLVTVTNQPPLPATLELSINSNSICLTDRFLYTWTSANADSITCNLFGRVSASGSQYYQPTSLGQVVATFRAWKGGISTVERTIVSNVTNCTPPTLALQINSNSICLTDRFLYTWTSANADSITCNLFGRVSASGSQYYQPTSLGQVVATFRAWKGGISTVERTIVTNVTNCSPPTLTLSVNANSICLTDRFLYTWTSANADSITCNLFGRVSASGSQYYQPTSLGQVVATFRAWKNGISTVERTIVTNVTNCSPPTLTLSVNANSICLGDDFVYTWTSANADSIVSNLFGLMPASGSRNYRPTSLGQVISTFRAWKNGISTVERTIVGQVDDCP